jgi:tellurite resistance protein TerC
VVLILSGIKLLLQKESQVQLENNILIKLFKRLVPNASLFLLVLLTIEITDLIFAIDSIPAIFAVTSDPFIVYTSNIFALLGLRSLYFALASMMDKFHYLKTGLACVLAFVGVKMLLSQVIHIHVVISLSVVMSILVTATIASLLFPPLKSEKY